MVDNASSDGTADAARDAMRPLVALYVGGMGSRKQNFYNALVRRYGFEDAAAEVQDLYLSGKKNDAAAVLQELTASQQYVTSYFVNEADKRSVEVHIANLRRKIGADRIETVRRAGYRMADR